MTTEQPAENVTYIYEKMTDKEWQDYCQKVAEENRRKLKKAHENRNSTASVCS
jgi:hypothetical protein